MRLQTFAVYDSQAKSYNQPFFFHNKEMAIRAFTDAAIDENSLFFKHPLDYVLFHLGEYDDENGWISSLKAPEMLLTSSQAQVKYLNTNENVKRIKSIQQYEGSTCLDEKETKKDV